MDRKFQIIQELMSELEGLMEHSPEELGSRLKRPAPEAKVEITSVEAEPTMELEDEMSEESMEDESPEDAFKKRLMKLRE